MRAKDIANRQVLIWAARNIGEMRRDLPMRLNRIDALLSGSINGSSNPGRAVLERLVGSGALSIGKDGLQKGQGFDAALAACAPERSQIRAGDLTPWAGKPYLRKPSRETLGQSPWMRAALGEVLCLQAEGRLEKIGIQPKRVALADSWNLFVETGEMPIELPWILRDHLYAEALSISAGAINFSGLEGLAAHLNAEIARGFSEKTAPGAGPMGRAFDRSAGDELTPCLIGWNMVLHTARAEDNYDLKPLDLSIRLPDAIHMEIPTGGDLCIGSARDIADPLSQALYDAHIDGVEMPDHFNADAGVLEFAQKTHALTGVMSVSMGDYFPMPVRERGTDRIVLASYGNTISPADAKELEEERDEDYLAGYFAIEDPRLEFMEGSAIEDMVIAPREALKRLFLKHSGLDESDVEAALRKEEEGPYRRIYRFRNVPETLHIYIPHGRAIERFKGAFEGSNLCCALRGGQPGLLISPDPVQFGPDYLAETVELEAPDLDEGLPDP